jgi:hypothetical protein
MCTLAIFVAFIPMVASFRSLGEIAHPNADFAKLWKQALAVKDPVELADFIVLNNMDGAATIGFLLNLFGELNGL